MATLTSKQAFIRDQFDKTRRRIRLLDLLAGGFGLLAGLLAFVALMVLLDVTFGLADATRQVLTLFFLVAAGSYAWLALVRPLRRDVNPHYAARKLEQAAGDGRHHVVNWVDLRDERLPAEFRAGLDRRAANDLEGEAPERAISSRWAVASAAAAGVLAAAVIGLFVALGPGPFVARFGRAFGAPLGVPARTTVEVITPDGGDGVVTIGGPALIVVKVGGRPPRADAADAPTVHVRHAPGEPARPRPLTEGADGEWSTTVGSLEVGNGFTYWTAGDAATPEYRIGVRASPSLSDFRATYRHRPYTGRADRARTARRLDGLRGTEVTLSAKPNRDVREAGLDFFGADEKRETARGEVTPDGLRFKLILDRPGKYQLRYTATTGEIYLDAAAHEVTVAPDNPPTVAFTAPAKDEEIPANGQLTLAADAADDFGIASLTLKRKVVGGRDLPDVPYLAGKLGTAAFGTPRALAYRELFRGEGLEPGSVIEYWLEALDGCDFPGPNRTESKRYKVKLKAPADAAAEKKKKGDEEKKKKDEHDKQQEEGLKKQKQERDDEKKQEGGDGASDNPKQGDDDTQKKGDALRESLDKKGDKGEEKPGKGKGAESQPKPGEGKDDKPNPGEGKGSGMSPTSPSPGESKGGENAEKGGEGKDGAKGEGKGEKPADKKDASPDKAGADRPGEKKPGQGKGAGEREGVSPSPGESKPGEGKPGEGKDGKPDDAAKPDAKAGEAKPGEPARRDDRAEGKPGGPPPDGARGKPTPETPPPDGKPGECKGPCPGGKGGEGKGDRPGGTGDNGKGDRPGAEGGMGASKEGDGPPSDGGTGRDGAPGEAAAGKPAGMGGTAGGADKPGELGMGTAPGGAGGKPGEAKGAGSGLGQPEAGPRPAGKRERPVSSRAMTLQLEEFRKAVGDDVLKDAKMSREQLERFLKDYAKMAGRRKRQEDESDDVKPGAKVGLPGAGGIGVKPTPGTPDAPAGGGRPDPPAEYRDSYAEFLRRIP